MLKPAFREGNTARSPQDPQEISLPEDSPEGVMDMCLLLHHNTKRLLQGLWSAYRLYHLAVTLDKYDCIEVCRLQCEALMARYSSPPCESNFEDYSMITATAYILGDSSAFRSATNKLITNITASYSKMRAFPEIGDIFPPQLLCMSAIRTRYNRQY